ncbi:ParB/RepB/Spo0J family partition protein [Pseudohongiella spirulinae]|uniref:ParB-like partitioning protein n=1 Tax=Pseudohongiella spirulinae TaxID=1249552 RepID=A0A0S2KEG7_9GAMM|nr:ParB/RepB/Spo0J family partition protein [Pseudohongiella spirulinae]ALO46367.1 ParB-like partitioning protein [Pseudohongiella spirulinae]
MSAMQSDKATSELKRVLRVSVDEVLPKPQVRKQFRNIDALAESLLVEGQQTPIIVSPRNQAGKYVIQKGERRWRACIQAGISHIDIIVNERQLSELDETAGELIENIQREDLTALEIAHALQKFINEGWKQVDIAKRLGKSSKYVSAYLGLLKLPPCVLQLYEQGICADTDTLNILRQLHELDEKRCNDLCVEAAGRGIHRQRARDVLNETFIKLDSASRNSPYGRLLKFAETTALNNRQNTWQITSPDDLRIIVRITSGPYNRQLGELLTDRISDNAREVWLKLEQDAGQILCMKASELRIVRLEKRDS